MNENPTTAVIARFEEDGKLLWVVLGMAVMMILGAGLIYWWIERAEGGARL